MSDLDLGIAELLSDWSGGVEAEINQIGEDLAKEALEKLKKTSPKRLRGGKYAKGWKVKRYGHRFIIHNENYRLPHLLEYGHAKVGGGRVEGIPHIKPVEDELVRKFTKAVEDVMR